MNNDQKIKSDLVVAFGSIIEKILRKAPPFENLPFNSNDSNRVN